MLTLTQAAAPGMPAGRVLKASAEERRSQRQPWASNQAATRPVPTLWPPAMFTFPAIFGLPPVPAASAIGGAAGG